MDILTEHRDGEITVFTNNSTPEIHLTTRRAEAKEEVAENMGAVTTVADNMEDVKGAAKYAQTFDDVLLNLPTIIKAMPAAETAVKAKDDAIVAKESAQESAEKAESAVVRAEEVTAEQVELAKGYAEQAKTEVSKISSAFKIVGTVPTVEDLPKNAEVGNIYLVGDNSITNKPEYVWTSGGTWEKFGETVDLSAYQTKEEAETALAEKQDTLTAGEGIKIEGNVISTEGGKLPDNVYTQDNLIAGKNVTFTEVPPEGGIDEYTLGVFHFDDASDPYKNAVEGGFIPNYSLNIASVSKFGSGAADGSGAFVKTSLSTNDDWTVDTWYMCSYADFPASLGITYGAFTEATNSAMTWGLQFNNGSSTTVNLYKQGTNIKSENISNPAATWHHLAMEKYGTTINGYLDGVKVISYTSEEVQNFDSERNLTANGSWNKFDETRFSAIARYKGEPFTPPTKPYTLATGPSKTAVNATVPTKLSELENDAGFITGGGSAEIPDNVYTADNLVSGDNITFTSKEAMFDAEIVGSPVISDNYEVSGFSDNDYLKYKDPIDTASNYKSFEIVCAFKANSFGMENAGLLDGGDTAGGYRFTIPSSGEIRARIMTSSAQQSYAVNILGTAKLSTGKKYLCKLAYSLDGYKLFLKEESSDWALIGSSSVTNVPYSTGSRNITIGDNVATGNYFDGTIYLKETYINIDGKRAWTGFLPDRTVVSADNVYTQTNLLGGKDIEIIPEPVEGGIDEYTLGVFHFDNGYTVNAVSGKDALGNQAQMLDSNYAKFGTKSGKGFDPNQAYINYYSNTGLTEEGDWTVDHWARFSGSGSKYQSSLGVGDTTNKYDLWVKFQTDTQMAYVLNNPTGTVVTKASAPINLPINEWVHLAAEKHGNTINGYLNGVKVISYTDSSVRNTLSTRELQTYPYCYIDELRFSTVARYKGEDFTPPTKAYRVAKPTGNMVVNFVGESGGAFDFQGTEAEFNAAVEAGKITDETVSLVTDDNSGELVATKAELAAVDRSKADTALSNVLANIDYVIESKFPTADDPTWYRKYKSGWLEQGGRFSGTLITFPKEFADTNYSFSGAGINTNAGGAANTVTNITTTSITYYTYGNAGGIWEAKGQGAE